MATQGGTVKGVLSGIVLAALTTTLATLPAPAQAATKVAVIVPLSGVLATAGREIEQTTRAWVQRAKGKGADIELLVLDDRSTGDGAREAATQAVAQGAQMVLNCFGSVACMAIAQELKPTAVPLLGAIAGDDRLRGPELPHVFTTRGSARDELDVILRYIKGVGSIDAVVVYQDDGFGQSYRRALDDVRQNHPQVNVVDVVALDPARKDYVGAAKAAMRKPSLGVILLANTPNSLGMIEALGSNGYRGLYFNLAAQANPQFIGRIGELTAANRMVAAFVTMTPHPQLPDHGIADYRTLVGAQGQRPTYLGLESYLNASLAGLVLQKEPKLGVDGVAKALTALSGRQLAGMTIKYQPDRRQAARWVNLSVVTKEGQVRSY